MGDYGFGLLQTANLPNGNALFGGSAAFRSSYPVPATAASNPPPPSSSSSSTPFPSISPGGFSSLPSTASVSSLFLSAAAAAAHQQNMQDELLLGVTTQQKQQQQQQQAAEKVPSGGKAGGPGGHQDYGSGKTQQQQLGQKRKEFSLQPIPPHTDFKQLSPHQQQELKKQPGDFSHLSPQYLSPKPEHNGELRLESPDKILPDELSSCSTAAGAASSSSGPEANAASPPSSSSSSVSLQAKAKIALEPPGSHLLSGGSAAAMLQGGFGGLQGQELAGPPAPGGSASPPLPGFGTPWSVQTSSPPPPPSVSGAPHPAGGGGGPIGALPAPESENFYPGIPSSINPAFFQSFSPVSHNPCAGMNVPGFSSPFSAQITLPQQQSRRSPVSPQLQHQHQAAFLQQRNSYNHHQPLLKQSPWSSHQGSGWSTGSMSWGGVHGRDHRRAGNMGIPGTINQISPLKKPFSGNVIAPPKFTRSTPSLTPKPWIDDNVFRTDNNSNTLLPLQDRSRMYDSLNMHSLENSLIDIMRAEHDPLKSRLSYPHPGTDNLLMLNARSYGRRRGRSSLFPIDDSLLDDGHSEQVGVLNSPNCYSGHQNGERIERFSRKVFVGGLPPDIDEDEITASFRRFGPLVVDWPHKAESKSYFPPKGYAFLLFQEESSVQALIDACIEEDGKLYLCVSSPTIKDKPVQIRPWNLSDSDFVMDGSQPLDPRKTIFVGGVPRPLRAVELAMIMDRLYGGVCYAGIDTDPELKYPKGAGRVAFSNQQSYIAAISARFVQLQHGDIDKRVEVKPYVLDDQMCDECQGARCGGKFAPFFCANVTCLQYYCEFCWANIHSRAGREFHKPLVKEGADRPRQIHFRWN
ncbi:cytoplasmic polyadenylation element-binding protein 2 isoform X2 [Rhinatrema bivittatum]|uniref:cytoplasmic polyadenylation element-binding protein 2 isoform X2 n=1 Tax=Rhinatrema bivittatum TaxID=194408 RepID=UPI00112EDAE9|nr:cytoplasmic polyadenylation element-binding protein 2 isoform X2 [Rhinatrema bivittatum]